MHIQSLSRDQILVVNRDVKKTILLIALSFVFQTIILSIPAFSKGYDYINITDPLIRKIPIAVTEFKAFNGHPIEIQEGKSALFMLKEALNFTGYLKTMNPVAFLSEPSKSGIAFGQINFRDWTGIGAELLITGGIRESNGQIKLELRLFDTYKHKLLAGSRYQGSRGMIRTMIHKFCSEVSMALTGSPGIFNSKIAFVSTVNGKKEIFTCDFDGKNVKRRTNYKSITLSPAWSWDGKWLSYVSYKRGRVEIFITNIRENRGAIVNYRGMNISPTWMPNQNKLAATLSFSGDQEIYLLTMKGKIIKRVTNSRGIDVSPDFSPDGKKIVFSSKRTGTPQIYTQDLESGKVERLTFKGSNNTSPAWSPDGRKIAYVGIEDNKINIYVINLSTGMPVQLTMNQGDNEDPSWSPDSSMITFTSTRNGGISRIFVMNASGSDQRQLFNLKGRQTQPSWSGSIQ